ncbi:hypothetical protein N3K66_000435 [Trichothecium roseum]|uniref:Uncharacterized protein n=1 Tax=Trichothecium roseum TaxID=47278 RepID=A0ACC0VDE4_9HYPO|nr:hypothetical protein N3K66_000435 [Trichothecium roseum]
MARNVRVPTDEEEALMVAATDASKMNREADDERRQAGEELTANEYTIDHAGEMREEEDKEYKEESGEGGAGGESKLGQASRELAGGAEEFSRARRGGEQPESSSQAEAEKEYKRRQAEELARRAGKQSQARRHGNKNKDTDA